MDAAISTLREAESRIAGSARLQRQLLDVYIRHNRRREALEEVGRLAFDKSHRDALRTAVRGACLAANEDWTAALPYLQSAFAAGCRDEFCLRWLAISWTHRRACELTPLRSANERSGQKFWRTYPMVRSTLPFSQAAAT